MSEKACTFVVLLLASPALVAPALVPVLVPSLSVAPYCGIAWCRLYQCGGGHVLCVHLNVEPPFARGPSFLPPTLLRTPSPTDLRACVARPQAEFHAHGFVGGGADSTVMAVLANDVTAVPHVGKSLARKSCARQSCCCFVAALVLAPVLVA